MGPFYTLLVEFLYVRASAWEEEPFSKGLEPYVCFKPNSQKSRSKFWKTYFIEKVFFYFLFIFPKKHINGCTLLCRWPTGQDGLWPRPLLKSGPSGMSAAVLLFCIFSYLSLWVDNSDLDWQPWQQSCRSVTLWYCSGSAYSWIRAADQWIRIGLRIRILQFSSLTFKMPTKTYFSAYLLFKL